MPRRGFWDARRDAASHFIRGASITSLPTQVAPKEAPARVPAGHGVAGRAASNRDLVAAEPKKRTADVDAICEKDADVVALPVACGEMAFRGEALEPVFPQRGPWAVRLELKGAGAVERPLAFVATRRPLLFAARRDHESSHAGRSEGGCTTCPGGQPNNGPRRVEP